LNASSWYRWDGADLLLAVKIRPRSSRDGFAEIQQDRIRVKITAPPVDGQANQHLCRWLARQFGVAKSHVKIENGLSSPLKCIRIQTPSRLPAQIDPAGT